MFRFTRTAIEPEPLRGELADPACGGYASFAVREGERILGEAMARFGVAHAACVHRLGDLAVGELAVWVGVSSPHRAEAFEACRYIIDEVKHRLPIWKKEHYAGGDSGWVNCERCAAPAAHEAEAPAAQAHGHAHRHGR